MSAATPAGSPLVAEKRALRQLMRARREELPPQERARASRALARAAAGPAGAGGGRLASRRSSPPGGRSMSRRRWPCAAAGARILYPRVTPERPRLRFCAVTPDTPLAPGVFGILEPPEDSPGVSMERDRRVAGAGTGLRSRRASAGLRRAGTTTRPRPSCGALGRGVLVGVGFDFQLIERCPVGEGDVAIDYVVTDARIIRCRPGSRPGNRPPHERHRDHGRGPGGYPAGGSVRVLRGAGLQGGRGARERERSDRQVVAAARAEAETTQREADGGRPGDRPEDPGRGGRGDPRAAAGAGAAGGGAGGQGRRRSSGGTGSSRTNGTSSARRSGS